MRRIRSAWERVAAQRNMTPGAAGGRTALVTPEPRPLQEPKTVTAEPLEPWGIAGSAPLFGDGWHGVYTDQAAATAVTGPVFEFGIDDASTDTVGLSLVPDAANTDGHVQLRCEDAGSSVVCELEMETGSGDARANLSANSGDESAQFIIDNGSSGFVRGYVDPTLAFIDVTEASQPPNPASGARLFAKDNGSGKTQLCVRFPTGASIVLATEP